MERNGAFFVSANCGRSKKSCQNQTKMVFFGDGTFGFFIIYKSEKSLGHGSPFSGIRCKLIVLVIL